MSSSEATYSVPESVREIENPPEHAPGPTRAGTTAVTPNFLATVLAVLSKSLYGAKQPVRAEEKRRALQPLEWRRQGGGVETV